MRFHCHVVSHKHQRPAARIVEDVVMYDYRLGQRTNLAPWAEEVLRNAAERERTSGSYWKGIRRRIQDDITGIEKETVLSGKEEDMGSGTS